MFETSAARGGEIFKICAETFACCDQILQHRYLPEIWSNPRRGQVPTDENIADFFTKPLAAKKFFPMRDRIMGVPGARALA